MSEDANELAQVKAQHNVVACVNCKQPVAVTALNAIRCGACTNCHFAGCRASGKHMKNEGWALADLEGELYDRGISLEEVENIHTECLTAADAASQISRDIYGG